MTPDTSAEAVERLAKEIQTIRWPLEEGCRLREDAAAALHALLAERDDLAADCVIRIALEADARHRAETERDALAAERDRLAAEVASLRLTLGGKTFSADVPEPIGCPLPGACATVAEIVRLRKALRQIRDLGLGPDRGSAQWQIGAANEIARAALAGEGRDG